MLAKAAAQIPVGNYAYEPKWDGFRCLVDRTVTGTRLISRGDKDLSRYFPEVVAAADALPRGCLLDGELVVRSGAPGAERLDWEALSARIHPAESRIAKLSAETPAEVVFFDALRIGDHDLMPEPFTARRAALETLLAEVTEPSLHLTACTPDVDLARDWFTRFEGAGLDGVMAKALDAPYQPGRRAMVKVKHRRTCDAVVIGYRRAVGAKASASSVPLIGSLLLGLYSDDGDLVKVGGIGALPDAARASLIDELAPLVVTDGDGVAVSAQADRTRFSSATDTAYVPLRPELVVEVAFDQLEGNRFRHAVSLLRWRADKHPSECLLDQVDRAIAYDLAAVFDLGAQP